MNIKDILIPVLYAKLNENKIDRKMKMLKLKDYQKYDTIPFDTLNNHNDKILKIRGKIEDKAKVNTIAITIAFTIAFGILSIFKFLNLRESIFTYILMIIIFYFLISSGWSAFRVLKIQMRYDLYLSDELKSEKKKKRELIECILKNQYANSIIVNYLYASYYQFTKSLVIVFILFAFIGFQIIR